MILNMLHVPGGTQPDGSLADSTVRWYDAGPADAPITVMWHHGTPNVGEPPIPLLEASAKRGIRWLGFDRPDYGGSSPVDGRRVSDAADIAARVADAAGVETFAVVGHSGGGPHALACAALLGDRVRAAVSISGLAPFDASGLDWFAGMNPGGVSELRAAMKGPSRLHTLLAASEFDAEMFSPGDRAALEGEWSWFNAIAGSGMARGLGGMMADDVAFVHPWGFPLDGITAPALFVHGTDDRIVPLAHGRWNAAAIPGAVWWERPGEGHISIMTSGVEILDWLVRALS